ncbi:MAG: RluA family pseudouridine synthase [Bacilli bacterium]|nr:RluA family pseudouridine synthase [Bacilli bacterium]
MQMEIKFSGTSERIDKYLANAIEEVTRSELKNYFTDGLISVNGKLVKPSYTLNEGDLIVIEPREVVSLDIEKEDIPLDVVYEDSDVIVVNKPSGMVVHPAFGHYQGTLVNALMHHCDDLSGINGVIRAGIVHRIDKDTSGLLVACKNDLAHKSLSKQLKDKTTTRKYIAIVCGQIPHNLGKINAPIGRDENNRQKMAVISGGKPAVTHFKVLERFKKYTLVECTLETGRTHQIRVHMSYIGYPVLGDPLYGPRKVYGNTGQFLHAKTLGFVHPRTNEYIEFSKDAPDVFYETIEEIKKGFLDK